MKILINVCTNDLPEEAFQELVNPFEEYEVFNFQFPITEYYLDIIDTILNYLSAEENIKPYESKIVLQSNIGNLLIAWYRLYNDIIDEFVLIDQQLIFFKSTIKTDEEVVSSLANLMSIENDSCHGRLYYRNSGPVRQELINPFMENYQYNLLRPFADLDFQSGHKKQKTVKGYKLKQQLYTRSTTGEIVDRIIKLENQQFQNDIQISKINTAYGYFLVFQYIIGLDIPGLQKAQAALMLNDDMTQENKLKVSEYIFEYLTCNQSELSFREMINHYTFLILLGTDKTVMEQMLNYIKVDEKYMLDHYAPYTNTLGYLSRSNQEEYACYFLDRVEIMRKLKNYYQPKCKIIAQRSPNHLVIVISQLLGYQHAPTKIIIDYANNLLKYYPELKIKIIVEDIFNYSPDELFFVNSFGSMESKAVSTEHKELLNSFIAVHYSNHELSREKRLQDDIKAITDFKPQWILKMGVSDSLAVDQLYDYYPISSMSMGGAEYSEFVHISFGGRSDKEVRDEREQKGVLNEDYKYEQHIPGFEFSKIQNKYRRNQHGLKADDFIIVTVGNRLATEIDEVFAEGMKQLLKNYSNIKWLIIGIEQHKLISEKFQDILDQVKFISYAENLIDVYAICDVYANPFRQGGGISVAMAMDAGLPVANLIGQNDANAYVPNGKAKNLENYFGYIENLFMDKVYFESERLYFQSEFRKKFGFEQAILHIMKLLKESEKFYEDPLNRDK